MVERHLSNTCNCNYDITPTICSAIIIKRDCYLCRILCLLWLDVPGTGRTCFTKKKKKFCILILEGGWRWMWRGLCAVRTRHTLHHFTQEQQILWKYWGNPSWYCQFFWRCVHFTYWRVLLWCLLQSVCLQMSALKTHGQQRELVLLL